MFQILSNSTESFAKTAKEVGQKISELNIFNKLENYIQQGNEWLNTTFNPTALLIIKVVILLFALYTVFKLLTKHFKFFMILSIILGVSITVLQFNPFSKFNSNYDYKIGIKGSVSSLVLTKDTKEKATKIEKEDAYKFNIKDGSLSFNLKNVKNKEQVKIYYLDKEKTPIKPTYIDTEILILDKIRGDIEINIDALKELIIENNTLEMIHTINGVENDNTTNKFEFKNDEKITIKLLPNIRIKNITNTNLIVEKQENGKLLISFAKDKLSGYLEIEKE